MKSHHFYYLFLFFIFLAGIIVISVLQFSKQLQIAILMMLAIFYVILGVVHHKIHHILTPKIVIEYIAIATLGIALILFVLQGI